MGNDGAGSTPALAPSKPDTRFRRDDRLGTRILRWHTPPRQLAHQREDEELARQRVSNAGNHAPDRGNQSDDRQDEDHPAYRPNVEPQHNEGEKDGSHADQRSHEDRDATAHPALEL